MPFTLRFRFLLPLCLGLLFALAPSAPALQLGETHEQLVARHGPPNDEDHARNLATYFWDGWSAQLEFRSGAVSRITYKRDWYLQDGEIASLLAANGGAGHWTELTSPGDKSRLWARDDGAAASCMAFHPLNMIFELGADTKIPPPAPKDAAPAAAPDPVPSPAADSPEQPAAVAEESAPSEPSPSIASPAKLPPPAASEPRPTPQRPSTAVGPVTRESVSAFAAGALVAFAGTALYLFVLKRRLRQAGAPH